MSDTDNYKEVHSEKHFGPSGWFGVKILVDAGDTFIVDMDTVRKAATDIFETANGYCPMFCCKDKPWFQVTTTVGEIVVGWRKHVINIDWKGVPSLMEKGSGLHPLLSTAFGVESTTVGNTYIHAHGYGKAKTYIRKIVAVAEELHEQNP